MEIQATLPIFRANVQLAWPTCFPSYSARDGPYRAGIYAAARNSPVKPASSSGFTSHA
jgi:hypothetical protein